MINILLVDDHKLVRDGLKMILSDDADLRVVAEAADGQIALDIMMSNPGQIDLVITDNQMPVMDGITLVNRIAQKYNDVGIIMLSMNADPAEVDRAMQAGVDAYLIKSAEVGELALKIKEIMSGKQSPK